MATARALQRLSRYPLVVLTNATRLPGGADVARSLARLNAQVLPVYDVRVPHSALPDDLRQRYGFWKLQIWRLTQFDKLIWLDTHAVLTRSVDWLFQRRPMWAQGVGGSCGAPERLPSGDIMLIEPGEATHEHLMRYARALPEEWWRYSRGASQYLGEYFQQVEKRPLQLLHESTASRSSCLGRLPGLGEQHIDVKQHLREQQHHSCYGSSALCSESREA